MYPKLFGIQFLNMYGLCIGIGVIACLMFVKYACKKLSIPDKFEEFVEVNAVVSIGCGILSGMLFQSFYNYLDNPSAGFKFTTDITFIGGLIGGAGLFLIIYFFYGRKKHGAYLMKLLPVAACCILVAHAFGRLGCFCAGCCYGKEAQPHAFLALYFPFRNSNNVITSYEWIYPTQLYESLFLFLMFGICAFITIKKQYKHTFSIYLICYGIFRFCIEYLRDDHRGSFIPGLTPSQFWSIIMVLIGITLFFVLPYVEKKFFAKKEQSVEELIDEAN